MRLHGWIDLIVHRPHFSDGAIEPDFRSLHTFKYHYRVVDIVACLFKAPVVPPKIETRDGKKALNIKINFGIFGQIELSFWSAIIVVLVAINSFHTKRIRTQAFLIV